MTSQRRRACAGGGGMNAAGPDVGHLASTAATPTVDGARPRRGRCRLVRVADLRCSADAGHRRAVLLGLAISMLLTPVVGRGDFGQWLMTSRFYLGSRCPAIA